MGILLYVLLLSSLAVMLSRARGFLSLDDFGIGNSWKGVWTLDILVYLDRGEMLDD